MRPFRRLILVLLLLLASTQLRAGPAAGDSSWGWGTSSTSPFFPLSTANSDGSLSIGAVGLTNGGSTVYLVPATGCKWPVGSSVVEMNTGLLRQIGNAGITLNGSGSGVAAVDFFSGSGSGLTSIPFTALSLVGSSPGQALGNVSGAWGFFTPSGGGGGSQTPWSSAINGAGNNFYGGANLDAVSAALNSLSVTNTIYANNIVATNVNGTAATNGLNVACFIASANVTGGTPKYMYFTGGVTSTLAGSAQAAGTFISGLHTISSIVVNTNSASIPLAGTNWTYNILTNSGGYTNTWAATGISAIFGPGGYTVTPAVTQINDQCVAIEISLPAGATVSCSVQITVY